MTEKNRKTKRKKKMIEGGKSGIREEKGYPKKKK